MIGRLSLTTQLESVIQPFSCPSTIGTTVSRVHRYFSLIFNLSLLSRLPVIAFTTIYHREIVEVVFAGRFLEYSYLLPLVALFTIGTAISTPITLVAQLEEKAQFILASKIFGVVGIGASVFLIPTAGVVGAVIASGTAIVLKNLFLWWSCGTSPAGPTRPDSCHARPSYGRPLQASRCCTEHGSQTTL